MSCYVIQLPNSVSHPVLFEHMSTENMHHIEHGEML